MRVRPTIRSSEIRNFAPGRTRRASTRVLAVRLLTATAAVVAAAALLGGALAPRGEAAATISAELVKDINPSGHSSPTYLTAIGTSVYFRADDAVHGLELWKSDGSAAGTVLVKDIYPGGGGSAPYNLTAIGTSLYFVATDAVHGFELWKSDGTDAGTVMVKDINPGGGDSNPDYLTAIGTSVYFQASDAVHGTELWKSDGTDAGTVLVKDIVPGVGGSAPYDLTAIGTNVYFQAWDGVHGTELWKSDGSAAGTVLVKDINPGVGGSNLDDLTAIGTSLYFQASDAVHGYELWKSDGSAAGTVLVKDINPGGGDSSPNALTAIGTSFYFTANDAVHGTELWKSDGSAAGTAMVADINPGSGDSNPDYLTAIGTSLYFQANDGSNGYELWRAGDFSPPETQIDSGPSGATAISTPTFTFSSDEAGTFQCSVDGGAMSACSSPSTLAALTDGAHTFSVRAIDSSANIDASPASRSFSVDTTAPDTQITSGPSGLVRTKNASFSFSSEASAGFECKLDAAAWAACSSPRSYTGLSDRAHTFYVRATDQVGNVDASPAKRSFTVDTRAPQTKIAKHPKKIVLTVKAMVKASFTFTSSEKSSRFSCKLDKKKWKSCRSRTTYKLKPGKHTLQVRATDRAGNTDRTPAKWVWTLKRG